MPKCFLHLRPGMLAPLTVPLLTMALCLAAPAVGAEEPIAPAELEFFETKIRPLLVTHCIDCHGEDLQEGALRLDLKAGWKVGGNSGTALVPGKPHESLLMQAVSYLEKDLQMPPDGQLSGAEIADLKTWIERGAHDPREGELATVAAVSDEWATAFQERLAWWSLQPLQSAVVPESSDPAWSAEPVDRFVRAAMDQAQLSPAPAAEPEVLLRRLSFVLTGLPPTVEQRARFLAHWQQDATAAYTALVDELLASPHFGERFARHWMDVVRYTDTYGYEWDNPAKGSWEYRDYLIRAFNQDIGFDQLIREQVAGDLLAEPRLNRELSINESLIGPMFYHLGEHRHGSSLMFNGIHQEMINNKIDAFSRAFLATTVACARCHDHKLEAVSQRDYYAMAAIFMTPRWTSRVIDAPGKHDAAIATLKTLRGDIQQEISRLWQEKSQQPESWSPAELAAVLAPLDPANVKPHEVAYPLVRLLKETGEPAAQWQTLLDEWNATRSAHTAASAGFTPLADFQSPGFPAGWVTEGDGLTHGYVDDGTVLVSLTGENAISRLLPRGYHTHALSSKLPGALRMPPEAQVPGQMVSVQMAAGEFGGSLVLEGNAFQNETVGFLTNVEPAWHSFADAALINGVNQVTVEFATAPLNPNFPPRTDLAPGLPHNDLGYDKRSWLSITGIVSHAASAPPSDPLDHFATLYQGAAPSSKEEAGQRLQSWLAGAVTRWCAGTPMAGDRRVVDWLLANNLLPNQSNASQRLAALVAEYRSVEATIAFPRTANSMDEREVAKASYPLNVRGNVDVQGELVAPDFLQIFAGRNQVAASSGSGRLELAASLVQPDHPLTSRVYVNRVWQWMFGAGLVTTPDDFGHLGTAPSHPELLDHLATEFVRDGWSTKKLVRRLALSQTFRQSGQMSTAAQQSDPGNRWLHHYPTRRLEAEAIRDALLATSGRLDPQLYGRPIDPPRSAEDAKKRLFTGPLDGNGRRSIYLKMSIMEPPKFLVGFNLPDLKLPTGRRDVTNVPGQALIMLNDPLVNSLARHWATRLTQQPHASAGERISTMFVQSLGRVPTATELTRWTAALETFATAGNADRMTDEAAWERLAHALFNTQEFIYYR